MTRLRPLTCPSQVGFEDPSRLEPIDGLASVPPARWALRCCLCRQPHGAPIQCAGNAKCARAFHPLCARAKGLVMEEATPLPSGQGRPFQGGTQASDAGTDRIEQQWSGSGGTRYGGSGSDTCDSSGNCGALAVAAAVALAERWGRSG